MAGPRQLFLLLLVCILALSLVFGKVDGQPRYSYNYYNQACPRALGTIRTAVRNALRADKSMGAALLRLHFHDCFVNGCDASILLDGENTEKNMNPNMGVRGYGVIDTIKSEVDRVCGASVVSCADILALAARDSVDFLEGPYYAVPLGRKDSRRAFADRTRALPGPTDSFSALVQSFRDQGLNLRDLVVLSGAHTIGSASCRFAKQRVESGDPIDREFSAGLRRVCQAPSWVDTIRLQMDDTPTTFDADYFVNLVQRKGVLESDQELYQGDGSQRDRMVEFYAYNTRAFFNDFATSMVKMGNIRPTTANDASEVRRICSRPN